MSNMDDYDLNIGVQDPPPPAPPSRLPTVWIAAAVVLVAVAAGAYLWLRQGATEQAADSTTPAVTITSPAQTPGGDIEPITVPLNESDPIVRQLVAALTSHPRVAAWLTTNGLIRNFVVVVENISMGTNPSRHLRVLRPSGPFRVVDRDEETLADPRNDERYNAVADAAVSIDAAGAANLYARLKPRIEEAYTELGREEPFDRALERAIVALLGVPIVTGDVRLEPEGATEYRYADRRLEQLTAAQKQLLRMGPRNVSVIQGKLREIALAVGIPAGRLPS
jgi:hypothetical protein